MKSPKKNKFSVGNARYTKAIMFLLAIVGVVLLVLRAADWGAKHQIIIQRPWDLSFKPAVMIEDRKPIEIISPLAEEIIEPKEELAPIEQKIVDKWGVKYGYIALAIFRCESGLRADAVNWDSRDIGITQINYPIWKDAVFKEFGYTLIDLFDVDKNLEVAYWVWDRADGTIDERGNFTPWVVFNNSSFKSCIE